MVDIPEYLLHPTVKDLAIRIAALLYEDLTCLDCEELKLEGSGFRILIQKIT